MSTKTIIVTGASRGLGLAIAQHIAESGNNVILMARSQEPLAAFQKQYGHSVQFIVGDLQDSSLARKAVEVAKENYGRLDGIVVNHCALVEMKRIADTSPEEWKALYDVNVFSGIAFAQAAIPLLRKSRGSIIFTSSGASKKANVAWGVYGSGKAVFDHLAGTIGAEEKNITALSIAPGTVDTDMQKEIRDKHHENFSESDANRFFELHREGKLLRPQVPGRLMARLALAPPLELSGRYFRYDDAALAAYRKRDD